MFIKISREMFYILMEKITFAIPSDVLIVR